MLLSKLTAQQKIDAAAIFVFLAVIALHIPIVAKKIPKPESPLASSRVLKITGGISREIPKPKVAPTPKPVAKKQEKKAEPVRKSPVKDAEKIVEEIVEKKEIVKPEIPQIDEAEQIEEIAEIFEGEGSSENFDGASEFVCETDFFDGATELTEATSGGGDIDIDFFRNQIMLLIQENKLYPKAARKRGLEGDVALGLTVGADGNLCAVEILDCAVNQLLKDAAVQSVKSAFKKPLAGIPEPITMNVTIRYSLTES